MSNDVTQWLAQIRAVRQQLADSIRDRDAAHESAANWRELYNTEAQQRRTETRLAQEEVQSLKAQIRQLQAEVAPPTKAPDDPEAAAAIAQTVSQVETVEELRAQLTEALVERDRLLSALKAEQSNHSQTRKSLTAVIGDTIDQLAKERGTYVDKPGGSSSEVSGLDQPGQGETS
ncbi:MAG: hypothetical protein KME06_06550 [Kastovskya adunca ATA6-11-RM4]|nr:hypothetical protein [Kastovskya adunca ATA6-11-RM4]